MEEHTEGVAEPSSTCIMGPSGASPKPPAFNTPAEHRRNRKSWSDEEKRAFWRQKKDEKKQRKKEAASQRQRDLQEVWVGLSEEQREMQRQQAIQVHERRRASEAALQKACTERLADPSLPILVMDLSFSWCMTVPDTKSTISQLKFSYSVLRKAAFPFRLVITSLIGREASDLVHSAAAQAEVLSSLPQFEGFSHFPPKITHDQHWSELYDASKVVFLTADAPDVLDTIQPDTVYVIGAFVDHNQQKGLSYAAAERHCVRSARLPIKESIDLGNRCKVLTINHVVDVLVRYTQQLPAKDGSSKWAAAIEAAIPIRRAQQELQGCRKRRRQAQSRKESEGTDTTSDAQDDLND